ncbi:LysE family translocator [Phaeacidiphilus oryzae]|uniref:LysE family translocator n=1 Tax=Phaeacidiphilus oryzae TaxID=348818 RepID=UPI00055C40BB|nr:LysE family translocator [Phaeacidiphilus oryzae]
MPSPDRILVFAAVSALLIVVPGPSVLFVVGRALAHGRRTALASVAGNAAGALLLVAAVAAGVGGLVERSVAVYTAVKLAGAVYLIWLGVRAIRHRGSLRAALATPATAPASASASASDSASGSASASASGVLRAMGEGLLVGVSNPKTVVFFAAVLPQFVDRGAGHTVLQMLLLGVVFNLIALVSDSVWGMAAAGARAWFARSPRRMAAIGGVGGLTMIGLGVTVAVTGRKD